MLKQNPMERPPGPRRRGLGYQYGYAIQVSWEKLSESVEFAARASGDDSARVGGVISDAPERVAC